MQHPHLPPVVASADVLEAPELYHAPTWRPYGHVWHSSVGSYFGAHIREAWPVIRLSLAVAGVALLINFAIMLLL